MVNFKPAIFLFYFLYNLVNLYTIIQRVIFELPIFFCLKYFPFGYVQFFSFANTTCFNSIDTMSNRLWLAMCNANVGDLQKQVRQFLSLLC